MSDEEMKPYDQAVWDWFLARAIIPHYYGGAREPETTQVREHLAKCGIAYDRSSLPEMGSFNVFRGTFAEDNTARGIVSAYWACRCDEDEDDAVCSYTHGDLVIEGDYSISQLIYEIVHTGLGDLAEKSGG